MAKWAKHFISGKNFQKRPNLANWPATLQLIHKNTPSEALRTFSRIFKTRLNLKKFAFSKNKQNNVVVSMTAKQGFLDI
jgi:hypothetical protein